MKNQFDLDLQVAKNEVASKGFNQPVVLSVLLHVQQVL